MSAKKKIDSRNTELANIVVSKKITGIPVVPVRDIVTFPGTIISLFIGRKKSINAISQVLKSDRLVCLVSQLDSDKDNVNQDDLPQIAVIGNILQCIVLPDETMKILVDCGARLKVEKYYFADIISCDGDAIEYDIINKSNCTVFLRSIIDEYERYMSLNKRVSSDSLKNVNSSENVSIVCDIASSYLTIPYAKKLELFCILDLEKRIKSLLEIMNNESEILMAERELQDQVKSQMDKNHREYYLREQQKAIQKELGEHDDNQEYITKYENWMSSKGGLSKEAKDKIYEEIKKLRNTPNMSSESGVIKSYLDTILSLPWEDFSHKALKISDSIDILSSTHYGMQKVKDRISEYIAVQNNTKQITGTVICLYGPPGVGKTTLVRSIAKAMGRKYVKVSLGGLSDSSELFGHRRTYIGAMPGKILQAMKKAEVSDPVILLDEIDKMSSNYRGDPSAAMLEILDPEQNKTFNDHYLEIGYDLSNVVFVATANSLNFSPPLKDRMEILHVPSYLESEKKEIVKKYILPKQFELCGISAENINLTDDGIDYIIQKYTREAGVRELERCIAKICRKVILEFAKASESADTPVKIKGKRIKISSIVKIDSKNVRDYLGIEKFTHSEIEPEDMIGVVNGLAYTAAGGDVLLIEGVKVPGKGEIKFTGSLGDVMKESIQVVFSYIKANAEKFNIDHEDIKKHDIHIHAPDGATPKDGPSAGVTIATVLLSIFSNTPVNKNVAMTGEVNLRGKVTAIGGLREKLVSAVRAGITDAIIPAENVKDLEDVPQEVKDKLKIHPCEKLEEVFKIALCNKKNKIKQSKSSNKPSISEEMGNLF